MAAADGIGEMNGLAICAGIGGLELGIRLAVPNYRTICYVEREAYAAATLVARMEDETLDPAPIWDDLTTFEGSAWRGIVDLISAGFPCQPWSVAGGQRGTSDERWIWGDIKRIIREVGPRFVFLENVPGLIAGGLEYVLRDLASLGFDAEWGCFTAEEIGAPHRRERLFILARRVFDTERNVLRDQSKRGEGSAQKTNSRNAESRDMGKDVANADSVGPSQPKRVESKSGGRIGDDGEEVANTELARREATGGGHKIDAGGELESRSIFPPGPDADGSQFPPGLEPAIRGVADGPPDRVERLRVLGNGVVPDVAALAWRELMDRFDA